jgi:hypothetical protein
VTVKVCAAEVAPRSTLPKLSEETEASTSATPRPESVAVRVGFAELVDTTLTLPESVPRAVGVNVTETTQLLFAAMEPAQVVAETVKLPVVETFETVSGIALVFVQVKLCAADALPTIVFGYVAVLGENVAVVGSPVPVRAAVRVGFAVEESVTVRAPVRVPLLSGAKTTEIVQLAPAASVAGQVLVWEKLPVTAMDLVAIAIALVLVKVKVFAVDVPPPAYTLPKSADAGVRVAVVSTPSPVSDTVRVGLLVESFVTVSVAVRVPIALGVNVTEIVQVWPIATEVQGEVWVKSPAFVPETAMFEIVTVEVKVVVFVKLTVCVAEPPRSTSPKWMDVGEIEAVVGTGGMRNATTKPSCGVRPAGVLALLVLMAAKSVVKCGCVTVET